MRSVVTALISVVVLAGSAFGGNIALSPGASAVCGGSGGAQGAASPESAVCQLTYGGTTYGAGNTINGIGISAPSAFPPNEWIAPVGLQDPYLLVTLAAPATVDWVTVSGYGTPGQELSFDVFVGSAATCAGDTTADQCANSLESTGVQIDPGGTTITGSASGWTSGPFAVSTSSQIQYVLYDVTESNGFCEFCVTAAFDNAYAAQVYVDSTPEPATFALIGTGLLALGFKWRSRRQK